MYYNKLYLSMVNNGMRSLTSRDSVCTLSATRVLQASGLRPPGAIQLQTGNLCPARAALDKHYGRRTLHSMHPPL
jgi:hypothetical protein